MKKTIFILSFLNSLYSVHAVGEEVICYAYSQQSLSNCVASVLEGSVEKIEIAQDIYCDVSDQECTYRLNDLNSNSREIEIYGAHADVTIYRNPSVNLFKIENSSNITIRDLNIVDREKRSHDYQSCSYTATESTPISIGMDISGGYGLSSNITLKNLHIDTREPRIIDIDRADNVNISNSSFTGSGHFGIWMSNQHLKSRIRIFDNTFSDIGTNAILTANVDKAWINGNTLHNNHDDNPFCMPDGKHTGGGQLLIEQGTRDLTLQSNKIYDGGNSAVSGIEFANGSVASITNVTIYANHIYNNPAGGIVFNSAVYENGIQKVVIKDNALYNNLSPQIKIEGHIDVDVYDNYYTQDLSSSPRANFKGTPKTCKLNGNSICSIPVKWSTYNASDVNVIVEDKVFSSNPSGKQTAPWIGRAGASFEIIKEDSSKELIARIYVEGE
ncbi:right-handed parallel beta-helix repeat-containing protein [Hahella sp. NBU794]|uniref:right-handed parallel beta-helix repeat-containing protein n=1 Tax=Hahella sp. NBU794 TaxID=3422590 RepID=UPI003D6F5DD8